MKTNTMAWGNPEIEIQQFVPNEYCETCFKYSAELYCQWANEGAAATNYHDGEYHSKASCGTSFVTVTIDNGEIVIWGRESYNPDDIHQGREVNLYDVVIPNILSLREGDTFEGATWASDLEGYGSFHHYGPGKVTDWELTKAGHPNHS